MFFDNTASSTALQDLNRVLLLCRIPPVDSLTTLSPKSDAGLARQMLDYTQRSVAAKGWWFNTDRRVTLSPIGDGTITIANAVAARASRRRPGDDLDQTPEVKLVVAEGSTSGELWNKEEDSWEFETDVMVDIIRPVDPNDLPEEFREYCIYRTASEFGFALGIGLDPTREEAALIELEKREADEMERINILVNDPHVADIWYR